MKISIGLTGSLLLDRIENQQSGCLIDDQFSNESSPTIDAEYVSAVMSIDGQPIKRQFGIRPVTKNYTQLLGVISETHSESFLSLT
jgi:hypothetical protein